MRTTEPAVMTKGVRISVDERERLQAAADTLYEGNVSMLIRRAIRDFLDQFDADDDHSAIARELERMAS